MRQAVGKRLPFRDVYAKNERTNGLSAENNPRLLTGTRSINNALHARDNVFHYGVPVSRATPLQLLPRFTRVLDRATREIFSFGEARADFFTDEHLARG